MMKTRLFFLIALLLSQSAIQAQQWFRYSGFPVNVVPKDIAVNDAGTLFMLTKNNKIFYKPLSGAWTEIPGPLAPDSIYWGTPAIAVEKGSNRLYVGTDPYPGGLFATSDLGHTWDIFSLSTNPVSGMHESYNCFTEIRDPNLFFAGTIGGIVKLTGRGSSGSIIEYGNPFTSSPEAVHYTRNRKLLIGAFNDGIWISPDNGATIRHTNFTAKQVYRFTEDPNGRVYALCKNLVNQKTELLYSDAYEDWNTVALPDPAETYTSIYYDSATANLWLGSLSGLYKTQISAITWQNANLNNGVHSVVEVIGDGQGGLYDFNRQHTAQKRNTGATAWEEINTGLTGKIDHFVFNRNNKLFGFEQYYSEQVSYLDPPSGTPPMIGSWQTSPPARTLKNITTVLTDQSDPNTIYHYALTTDGGKLYRSGDAGVSYTEVNTPPGFSTTSSYISTLTAGEQSGLFALGTDGLNPTIENKIFASFDKGATWSQISDFGSRVDAVAQDAHGQLFALVTIDTTFTINLYHSSDTGQNWNLVVEDVLPFTRLTLCAKGPSTFLYNDRELYTIDPAASSPLTAINLPWPPSDFSKTLNTFQVSRSGNLFIYANDLYRSADTGSTWTNLGHPAIVPTDNLAYGLQIAFDSIPFMIPWPVTNSDRGIYYYRSTPMLSIRNISQTHNLVVYPNPAAHTLQIKTDYRGDISLLNVVGQQLNRYRIRKEETEIDIDGLAAGVYLIRLEETGQSIKVVKR